MTACSGARATDRESTDPGEPFGSLWSTKTWRLVRLCDTTRSQFHKYTFHGVWSHSRKLISFKALTQTTLLNQPISEAKASDTQSQVQRILRLSTCTPCRCRRRGYKIWNRDKDIVRRWRWQWWHGFVAHGKEWWRANNAKCESIRFVFFFVFAQF